MTEPNAYQPPTAELERPTTAATGDAIWVRRGLAIFIVVSAGRLFANLFGFAMPFALSAMVDDVNRWPELFAQYRTGQQVLSLALFVVYVVGLIFIARAQRARAAAVVAMVLVVTSRITSLIWPFTPSLLGSVQPVYGFLQVALTAASLAALTWLLHHLARDRGMRIVPRLLWAAWAIATIGQASGTVMVAMGAKRAMVAATSVHAIGYVLHTLLVLILATRLRKPQRTAV